MSEGLTYGQNPLVAGLGVGGPVINDVIGMTLYNRGLIETIARKAPLTGTKTVFGRNLGDFIESLIRLYNKQVKKQISFLVVKLEELLGFLQVLPKKNNKGYFQKGYLNLKVG